MWSLIISTLPQWDLVFVCLGPIWCDFSFIWLLGCLLKSFCLIWNAHICSHSISLSFLYTRAKIWLVSKGHLSKQLVCIRDSDDIILQGFGWGSVVPNQFKREQVSVYVFLLPSSAVNGIIISHHKYLLEIKLWIAKLSKSAQISIKMATFQRWVQTTEKPYEPN